MRGSSIAALVMFGLTGVVIANIITHPVGTQAAANGIATVSKPWLNALLGVPSR